MRNEAEGRAGESLGLQRNESESSPMKAALDLVEAGPLPYSHSHACVVVDVAREAEAELSFFDYQHQAYIGESELSPRPFFFHGRMRTHADGRTGYVVGPEVTRFLRRDARIGVAS
jgi:hypothetical protein